MNKTAFLFAAMLAAMLAETGICAVCAAGEELMPLVPGAFSPVEFDDDGTQLRRVSSNDVDPGEGKRPALRKNIIRLTMPSLGEKTNAKMRMVEAAPAGPDGTLQFRPLESVPSVSASASASASMSAARRGGGQADIPGLVPPELLAVSRMEQGRTTARGGFSPIRLPGALALGTEELSEFDPYSVQRTGNPFKDAPGTAEAFPVAAIQSRVWERPYFDNNELRPPKTVRNTGMKQDAGTVGVIAPQAASLRPPAAGASLRPAAPAALRPVASATRQAAPITVAEITLPAVRESLAVQRIQNVQRVREMPPLPELPVRSYAGGVQTRKAEVVSLPPPLPDRETRNKGEFSLLSPSAQSVVTAGLNLALPPTALTEGGEFFVPQPVTAQPSQSQFIPPAQPVQTVSSAPARPQPVRPAVAEGVFLQPGEKIIDPQTPAPAPVPQAQRARQMVQAPALRHSVPVLSADEFTPVRGMRVY